MLRQQLGLASLTRAKPGCGGLGVRVVEDDVGASRQACFAGRAAADVGACDAVDEGGGGEGVAALEGGPARGIGLEKGTWRCGGWHFGVEVGDGHPV